MASVVVEVCCLPSVDIEDIPECDAMVLPVFEDERPLRSLSGRADWRMQGALSRLTRGRVFRGLAGESCLVPSHGRLPADKLLLLGLGPRNVYSTTQALRRFKQAIALLKDLGAQSQCWPLFDLADGQLTPDEAAVWILEALEWQQPETAMGFAIVGGGPWSHSLRAGLSERALMEGVPWELRYPD